VRHRGQTATDPADLAGVNNACGNESMPNVAMSSNVEVHVLQGFPHGRYPAGWFQIGWSDDFPAGVSKPLRYFGRDLVVFRGGAGVLHVMDAFCPHMGAHLGHGGRVLQDAIACPFHGWVWKDGVNLEIPDAPRPNRAKRLKSWPVRELSGIAVMWYDPVDREPSWEIPRLIENPEAYYPIIPHCIRLWRGGLHPQVVAENSVDSSHFAYVHKAGRPANTIRMEDHGARLHVTQEIAYGSNKKSTWLTPDGPKMGTLEIDLWGIGVILTKFHGADEAYSLVACIPVDETTGEFRMTNWSPRDGSSTDAMSDLARRRTAEQFKQTDRDVIIWENMKYIDRPPVTKIEARPYRAFRTWSDRFYGDEPVRDASEPVHVELVSS
jgi:3-ketosteroid 9alpha-monooxygenase subunit A